MNILLLLDVGNARVIIEVMLHIETITPYIIIITNFIRGIFPTENIIYI